MTYLLTWKGAYKNIDIGRYADKAAAKHILDNIEDPAVGGCEVDSELDLDYPKADLSAMYNALGKFVSDDPTAQIFRTKAEGQRLIFTRIEDVAKNLPITEVIVTPVEPIAEAPASEPIEETTDMATAKKKSARSKKAKTKTVRVAKAKTTNGTGTKRADGVSALITKMLERDRGATKKEIIASALEKTPDYDPIRLDNTVRGILSVMGRSTPKFKKAKDEKRGLVYSIG